MENIQVTINLPKKYLKAIEMAIDSLPENTTIEDYILECLRSGLEADAFEAIQYYEHTSTKHLNEL